MPNIGEVYTVPKEDGLDVEWRIESFNSYERDIIFSSPHFFFNSHLWCLMIYKHPTYYELYLCRISPGPTIRQEFSIYLKTLTGQKEFEIHLTENFDELYRSLSQLVSKYHISRREHELIHYGVLTIVCTMKIPTSARCGNCYNRQNVSRIPAKTQKKRKAVTESTSDSEPEKLPKTAEKGGCKKLSNDLKEMMLSGDHSDTTIRVKGEDFKLHRNILSARNPYFCSMFKTDMLEKTTGIVSIKDCEPHVFRSFIYFIYTGRVDKMSHENVCDLYEIADKYQEDELKKECLSCMMDIISVDNFCDFTALALKYDENKLLETATNFFCIKFKQIIRCEKWQAFLREYPSQANELIIEATDNSDESD